MNRRGKKRVSCAASELKKPSMTTLRPRSSARRPVATTCPGVRLRPNDAASPATSKKAVSVAPGAVGLQGGKPILPATRAHERYGRLLGSLGGRHIADQTRPQGGIRHLIGGSRLEKALPARQFTCCRYLHLTDVLVALDGAHIPMMGPLNQVGISQPLHILVQQSILR